MKSLKFHHISFLVAFLSIFFVLVLLPLFVHAQGPLVPCDETNNPCDWQQFVLLIQHIINFMIFNLAAPFAAISFAVAGVMFMTAGGNEAQARKAKSIFYYVIIGLVIALAAWSIVFFIVNTLVGNGGNFNISNYLGP